MSPPAPTPNPLADLQATVAALTKRVALLEVLAGAETQQTVDDLDDTLIVGLAGEPAVAARARIAAHMKGGR